MVEEKDLEKMHFSSKKRYEIKLTEFRKREYQKIAKSF